MIKLRSLTSILILAIYLGACSQAPVKGTGNDSEISTAERRRLHDEYGRLLERLSRDLGASRARNFICMDINRLRTIGNLLDNDLSSRGRPQDQLYSGKLKHQAIVDYCVHARPNANLEMSARLRALTQLEQARYQWRQLDL